MTDISFDVIPIIVVTGFLGSGKTTLLKRILSNEAFGDTAVLVNEFGEVGLDHLLLGEVAPDTVLLSSGCLCCSIRGELSDALRDLYSRRQRGDIPPFRRAVLETTGLADPSPIISTILADPVLKHHFRTGAVITTVDAANALADHAHQPEWVPQIAAADRLVITKTDLVDPGALTELETGLRQVNPSAALVHSEVFDEQDFLDNQGVVQSDSVKEVARWFRRPNPTARAGLRLARDGATGEDHLVNVNSFCITLDGQIDWTAFALWFSMLLHCHGKRILRVKGLINVTGSTTPVALHGVQHVIHPPVHLNCWPDADRRSRIVFITRGLGEEEIKSSLNAFLSALET